MVKRSMYRVSDLVEQAWASRQPVTLKFQTMAGRPLDELLVLVRYNRRK